MVEAKAYIEEGVDYSSKATSESLKQIREALARAKSHYSAAVDASWDTPFYQYANRLAHLYFARHLNGLDAYLLFLYFADAPDVPKPCTTQQWQGAERLTKKCLGLGAHPFRDHVDTIIWSSPRYAIGRHPSRRNLHDGVVEPLLYIRRQKYLAPKIPRPKDLIGGTKIRVRDRLHHSP